MNSYLEFMLFDSDVEPFGLPDGVLFLTSEEIEELEKREEKLISIFKARNYKKVIPPAFEYYETFERAGGYDVARRSFSFKDKDGKLLSLRFDMTTPIARMIAQKTLKEKVYKLYYSGNVFREQPFHKGKLRELRQCGIELIGENSSSSDMEVIEMFKESLEVISDDYTIVIGNVKPYKNLLGNLNLSESKKEAMGSIFNKKDITSLKIMLSQLNNVDDEIKNDLLNLIDFSGKVEDLQKRTKIFGKNIKEEVEKFIEFCMSISKSTKEKIIIDLAMVKDFSYYSSITLEGYIKTIGHPIANGGRYDELFKRFDSNLPAIGFAIDLIL